MKGPQAGFSLLELIMVMAIMGFVSGLAATLLQLGVQGSQRAENQNAVDWSAREGLERLSRELRSIRPGLITTMTASQLSYTSLEGESISFVYSGSSLTRNGDVLWSNLSSFTFNYYTGAGAATTTASTLRLIQLEASFTQNGVTSPTYVTAVATNVT